MPPPRNSFGVPQYPSNDARYLFILLCAIDLLERPTAAAIADLTGHDRDHIDQEVHVLREQYGVAVSRVGEVYHIESWGDVLQAEGVKKFLKA